MAVCRSKPMSDPPALQAPESLGFKGVEGWVPKP